MMTTARIRVTGPYDREDFPRYLDALRWAQDQADPTRPLRIERIDNGRLLSERRADGRWYNANGDPLPSPPVRER